MKRSHRKCIRNQSKEFWSLSFWEKFCEFPLFWLDIINMIQSVFMEILSILFIPHVFVRFFCTFPFAHWIILAFVYEVICFIFRSVGKLILTTKKKKELLFFLLIFYFFFNLLLFCFFSFAENVLFCSILRFIVI